MNFEEPYSLIDSMKQIEEQIKSFEERLNFLEANSNAVQYKENTIEFSKAFLDAINHQTAFTSFKLPKIDRYELLIQNKPTIKYIINKYENRFKRTIYSKEDIASFSNDESIMCDFYKLCCFFQANNKEITMQIEETDKCNHKGLALYQISLVTD